MLRYILQTVSGLSIIPTGFVMVFFLPLRIFRAQTFQAFCILILQSTFYPFKAQELFYFSKCYQQNAKSDTSRESRNYYSKKATNKIRWLWLHANLTNLYGLKRYQEMFLERRQRIFMLTFHLKGSMGSSELKKVVSCWQFKLCLQIII